MSRTKGLLMRRTRQAVVIATTAAFAALGVGVGPAAAETSETQTVEIDLGDMDRAATGTFQQFDPSLGTLTSVEITADVTMDFDVCMTNLSDQASSLPAGEASGAAPITFAGGVVANATGAMTVPAIELAPSAGGDPCGTWEAGGAEPASADSRLTSETDVSNFSETITDPAALEEYTGTGTVPFNWTASSASDLSQPSEWTIVFLASGRGTASIQYNFEPGDNPPPEPPEPPVPPEPPEPTSPGGILPDTGGPASLLLILGGLLLLAGGGVLAARRLRQDSA